MLYFSENMKIRLLITLCCVIFLSDEVLANGDNEIKKGVYPYMAFIYYPDESVVEVSGARFVRGAVLVKPTWLITSSVGPWALTDSSVGFPRKTLLARLGAVTIDSKFTLNEDEDEQEREVIEIVRPHNHSATQWWRTDLTLLKTLLPFNMSSVVGTATLRTRQDVIEGKNCFILVYSKKFGNWTEDKTLIQLSVDLQDAASGTCGNHFYEQTMLCAVDSDENKNIVYDPDFCLSNSGGPLVCENEVTGIQTYIENNCKPPHLYQLLSVWDNFITCGIEDKCHEEHCSKMCIVINKDDPMINKDESTTAEDGKVEFVVVSSDATEEITMLTSQSTEPFSISFEEESTYVSRAPSTETDKPTTSKKATVTLTTTTVYTTDEVITKETMEGSWPKEKYPPTRDNDEEALPERKATMEAQQDATPEKTKRSSASEKNWCLPQSLFNLFLLVCLM